MMMAGPRLSYLFRPRHDRTGDAISAIILLEALFVNINNPVNINIDEPVNGDRYHHCCDGSSAIFFFFSKFLFPFQPSSSGFEVEGNLRTLSFDRIGLPIFLQILS